MNIKSVKNRNLVLIISIIFSSFLFSIFSINFYLDKYDRLEAFQNNNHPMLKSAVQNHWSEANKIVQDFKSGKKFFESGKIYEDEFLPQKLLSLYFLTNNQKLYNKNLIEVNNGKFLYLSIKSFFYFFLILFFYKK